MFSPLSHIIGIRITSIFLVVVLSITALGVYTNFDLLNRAISVGFFLLALISISLKYRRIGIIWLILSSMYFLSKSIDFPRHIWVILDVLSGAGTSYFMSWSTNPFKKGTRFEQYIASLFPRDEFSIIDHTRDTSKLLNRPIESSSHPDFTFRHKKSGKEFAIECKWRGRWWQPKNELESGISWNIRHTFQYQKFEEKSKIPVFIAFGIGGVQSNPDELYFLDLAKIKHYSFLRQSFVRNGYSIEHIKNLIR
jgi:hypothetical protein